MTKNWLKIKSKEEIIYILFFYFSAPTHQLSSSALLSDAPDHDSLHGSRLNMGSSRLNMSISRLNMNDSLVQGPPPPPSIWDCLVSCHSRMGQRLARKRVSTVFVKIFAVLFRSGEFWWFVKIRKNQDS